MSNDLPEPVDRRRHEEALHLRINELEHETERLRRLSVLLLVGTVGAVGLGLAGVALSRAEASRSIVSAQGVLLKDGAGVVRGSWRILEDGSTSLALNDRNGIGRAKLTVLDNGAPGISLTDNRGRSRVVLSLLPDMTSTLAFADDDGNTRSVIGLGADGSATIAFVDVFGATRAGFGIDPSGEPVFSMVDSEGDSGSDPGPPAPLPRP